MSEFPASVCCRECGEPCAGHTAVCRFQDGTCNCPPALPRVVPPFIAGHVLRGLKEAAGQHARYSGPDIEWTCSQLAATCPPPQVALSAEYLRANEVEVDLAYLLTLAFQAGVENGYRIAVKEADLEARAVLRYADKP